jgi:hypothetical protein
MVAPQEVPMKPASRSIRTPLPLSSTLNKNLSAYVLSAAAAGVATLAAASPAAAEIVYTPTNQKIAGNTPLNLDLNNDGVIDFKLLNFAHFSTTPFGEDLDITAAIKENGFVGGTLRRFNYLAQALPAGVQVGASRQFLNKGANLAYASLTALTYVSGGQWKDATNRYLGLKFLIHGEIHYGWARLTVHANKHTEQVNAVLTGYAYETVANQPITTGKTSGTDDKASLTRPTDNPRPALPLALLALGSPGLALWRGKETN